MTSTLSQFFAEVGSGRRRRKRGISRGDHEHCQCCCGRSCRSPRRLSRTSFSKCSGADNGPVLPEAGIQENLIPAFALRSTSSAGFRCAGLALGDSGWAGQAVAKAPRIMGDWGQHSAQELIESNGGRAAGSVSKATSLLVCGEEGSAKWNKAKELGIRVVTPDEFAQMLDDGDA